MRRGMLIIGGLLVAACASNDGEWTGDGVEAFDTAHVTCTREASYTAEGVRASAYRACMAGRGWTQATPAQ